MSILNYALERLKAKHIAVCGHYNCGGVKAVMQSINLDILNPWLRNIRDVYGLHKEELNKITDKGECYNRLVELNFQEECMNAVEQVYVQKAYRKGSVKIQGWVFDIKSDKLIDLNMDFERLVGGLTDIYKIHG